MVNMRYTTNAIIAAARKADLLADHYGAMFWAVISPIANVAVMETESAYQALAADKVVFRKEVKKLAKTAKSRIDRYDGKIMAKMKDNIFGDRTQYWLDYTDAHYEALRRDIDILRLSILQVLTKNEIPKRDIFSRVLLAEGLLHYSIDMYDKFFEKIEETHHITLKDQYSAARLSYVLSPWERIVDILSRDYGSVDVKDDKNVETAFRIIEKKCVDADVLHEICNTALSYNGSIKTYENPYNSEFNKTFSSCFGDEYSKTI